MVDDAKLHQFVGQMLADLGGAASIALVRIGDALGLYKALHNGGAMTVAELAAAAGVNQRYLREWLSHQAASSYVSYDPATQKFTLPPEQAMVFAIEDSPVFMPGAFSCMASILDNQPKVEPAFKTGAGVGWGDQATCLFCAVARFFRPGYHNNLVSNWLPALDGVVTKLEKGAKVADVGCGHGVSTVMMAQAFPNSQFVGYDFHRALSSTPRLMPASMVSAPTAGSRSGRQRITQRRNSISSRFSTVCTTWATPRARPRMSGSR